MNHHAAGEHPHRAGSEPGASELGGVPETALITLYNRASEARRTDALIADPLAVEVFSGLEIPFEEKFGRPDLSHVVRAVQFDREVHDFLRGHPTGVVVSLGEGLETELWRAGGSATRWISVDLPEIVALRRRLLPPHPQSELVAASALDPVWTERLEPGVPLLILAQGLLMYFARSDVEAFFRMLRAHCPGARVIFDTIPAWAATTTTGHRQTASYRMPAQPWGTGRRGLRRLLRDCGVEAVTVLPTPRGRGVGWGVLNPVVTRLLPGLLPMTIAAEIPV